MAYVDWMISDHHRDCCGALFRIACGPYGIIQ